LPDINQALHDHIEDPSEVAAEQTDDGSQDSGNRYRSETDKHRHPGTDYNTTENVATQVIRTKEMIGRRTLKPY
jgi:hypothetical protein